MKEHGMELSLSKTNNLASNETPTPTRFLRNCEDIGLFQDLNPFEETFKKAFENSKRGAHKPQTLSVLGKAAGDDLHTPQVFPDGSEFHLAESDHIVQAVQPEVVVRSEADTSITSQNTPPASQPVLVSQGNVTEDSVHVLFEMPNGTVLQLSAKPVKNDAPQVREAIKIASAKTVSSNAVILTTPNINPTDLPPSCPPNPLVKEKLKAFLDGSIKARQEKIKPSTRPTQVPIPQKRPIPNLEDSRPVPSISDPTNETDDDRKRKIQERNRRAAYRCREKRKRHMQNLLNDNRLLTQEVVSLRAEVVRLQTLLMCHTNCTLTSSQRVPDMCPSVETNIEVCDNTTSLQLKGGRSTQQRKEGLTLDIVRASQNTMMDLDSPSIVRRDEVLSSVAPPSTPDDKIDSFLDLERDMGEPLDKQINTTTTVIQLNPNVLKPNGSSSI